MDVDLQKVEMVSEDLVDGIANGRLAFKRYQQQALSLCCEVLLGRDRFLAQACRQILLAEQSGRCSFKSGKSADVRWVGGADCHHPLLRSLVPV